MDSYLVTIQNWEKHNSSKKKNRMYFSIENRFFEDSKTTQLSPMDTLLFIRMLAIAGDLNSKTITINHCMIPKRWRISAKSMLNHLISLQRIQLLTYEIKYCEKINETKKVKRKENVKTEVLDKSEKDAQKEGNRMIWDSYLSAFRSRYGVDPVRNATVNSQISRLRVRLGVDDAVKVVGFYVKHNDSFYLKKTHDFGLCLKDAETLRTQMLRGRAITGSMVRSFEKSQSTSDTLKMIQEEGI